MQMQATSSCHPITAIFELPSAHPDFVAKMAGQELLVVEMGMHSEKGNVGANAMKRVSMQDPEAWHAWTGIGIL